MELAFCLAWILPGLATGGVLSLALYISRRRLNAVDYQRAFYAVARRTGLTFEEGQYASSPHLTGRYRERQVMVNLRVRRMVPLDAETRFIVQLKRPLPGVVQIEENGWERRLWLRFRQRFGAGEDLAFVRRYRIRSEPPRLGVPLLIWPGLRRKLLAAHSVEIECKDHTATLIQSGIQSDPEEVLRLLDLLSETARLLEAEVPEPNRTL